MHYDAVLLYKESFGRLKACGVVLKRERKINSKWRPTITAFFAFALRRCASAQTDSAAAENVVNI